MAHRDFDQERKAKLAEQDAVTFDLGGHTFTCRRKLNPDVLAEWAMLGQDTNDADALPKLDAIMEAVIVPDDVSLYQDVRRVREPDEDVIDALDLMALIEWIVEEVVRRPFTSRSDSGPSPTAPPATTQQTPTPTTPSLTAVPGSTVAQGSAV